MEKGNFVIVVAIYDGIIIRESVDYFARAKEYTFLTEVNIRGLCF